MTYDRRKREQVYFFAHDPGFAPYYDVIDELVQPQLCLIHDMMVDLVTETLRRKTHNSPIGQPILVVGSGTGAEVLRLVKRLPGRRIVAVDFSPAMNTQLRSKFEAQFPERDFDQTVAIIEDDFLSEICKPDGLISLAASRFEADSFDAVVIGFVTHHYTNAEKLEFYRRAAAVLAENGCLVHGDLFNFGSRWLSALAHEMGERWIRKQLTDPEPASEVRFAKVQHIAARLCEAWVRHWNATHIYAPVQHTNEACIGPAAPSHLEMLHDVGFTEVECPFRLWEVAILWASSLRSSNSAR